MSNFIGYYKQLSQGIAEIQLNYANKLSQPLMEALSELQQELNSHKHTLGQKQKVGEEVAVSKNGMVQAFNYHKKQHKRLNQLENMLLNEHLFENDDRGMVDFFRSFRNALPSIVQREQTINNFKATKLESFFLKGLKTLKHLVFVLSKLPRHFTNVFLKWFKKPLKPVNYWSHKVYLDIIIEEQFYSFLEALALFKKQELIKLIQIVESLSENEKNTLLGPVDLRKSEVAIGSFFEQYKKALSHYVITYFKTHENDYLRKIAVSGTIEQPLFVLKKKRNRVKKSAEIVYKKYAEKTKGALTLIANNWKFSHELFMVTLKIKQSISDLAKLLNESLSQSALRALEQQQQFVDGLYTDVESLHKDSSTEELRSYIVKGIYNINRTLKKQVAETNQVLSSQKLLNAFSRLEVEANDSLLLFSDKIGYADPKYFYEGVPLNEISFFAPQHVVQYNGLKEYMESLQKAKHELSKNLEELSSINSDFQQSLDFCFDSSLLLLTNSNQDGKKEDPYDVLFEGIEKARARNKEIKQLIVSDFKRLTNKMAANASKLIANIQRLQIQKHQEEYIQRLQREILLQKTDKYKNRLSKIGIKTWVDLKHFIRLNYKKIRVLLNSIKAKLHLSVEDKHITSELSNFLTEIHTNKSRLPLVYQNLFELKPIDEVNLFQGRGNELNKLNTAYKDWQSGNYAATIITGENGSGKSSLLKNFKQQNKFSYKVYYYIVDEFYFSEKHFFKLLSNVFGEPMDSKEKVQDFFDESRNKRIVLIDGLEKVFLRKINGNACIQQLLQLIAQTNKQVFWVATSSKYAWSYLNKTLQVNDFFDYKLELGELKKNEIQSIILKRNRLSGFKIHFETDKEDLNNKAFKKLNAQEQQAFLENKYFLKLNRFAISNISLALTYWLYSIHKIKDDTLTIKRFNVPEFSFVNNLSPDKVYTLLIIVFHSKINVAHHAQIFNQVPEKSSRILLVMSEDGILVKKDEYYIIHSVLLRHIIDLLKKRNLIH